MCSSIPKHVCAGVLFVSASCFTLVFPPGLYHKGAQHEATQGTIIKLSLTFTSRMYAQCTYILLGKKSFCKTSFPLRIDGAGKRRMKGEDERTQKDYRTPAKICRRCLVVVLCFFISALFLSFFSSIRCPVVFLHFFIPALFLSFLQLH